MRRVLLVVGVVVFCGCRGAEPLPRFGMQVLRPAAAGCVGVELWVEEGARDASLTLHVFDGATEVLTTAGPTSEGYSCLALDAGDFTTKLDLELAGKVVASQTDDVHVYPVQRLTRRLPWSCETLVPLDDDATRFLCGHREPSVRQQLIDADGGVIAEYLDALVNVVRTPEGPQFWVGSAGSLKLETPQGDSNSVAFPRDANRVAAADFAFSGSTLALLDGGVLSVVEFDARGFTEPRAAVSRDGHRAVLFETGTYGWFSKTYAACLLEFDVTWRLTACPTVTGNFVRQDARDGRVLFATLTQLVWFDLWDTEHPTVVGPLRTEEAVMADGRLLLGGGRFLVDGRGENVFAVATPRWADFTLPDGGAVPEEDLFFSASSELVWGTAMGGSQTFWEPLR